MSPVSEFFALLANRFGLTPAPDAPEFAPALEKAQRIFAPFPADAQAFFWELERLFGSVGLPRLFYGFDTYTLGGALAHRAGMQHLHSEPIRSDRSEPENAVALAWVTPGFLPFANDASTCYIALDFNPGPNGTRGQLVNMEASASVKYVLFDSVTDFCAAMLRAEAAGRLVFERESLYVDLRELEESHVVDEVAARGVAWLREG